MEDQSAAETTLALSKRGKQEIVQTCLDYIDGWYSADPDRMARALHPDLVKRTVRQDTSGAWVVGPSTTAEAMVGYTRSGGGSHVLESDRIYNIEILDVFQHISLVKALSPLYMDYIQLGKFKDRWLIVNVLWEEREEEAVE